MPNIIQHKRSSTPGAVPLATGLSQGELGINIGDGKLYTKNSSNAIINLGVSSISGTYITPASGTFQTIQFNTNVEPDLLRGQIGWNDTEGTVNVALTDNTDIHIGQHNFYRVRNQTGSVLYKGQAVYATGVHSNGIITPSLYVANGSVREVRFIGLILENINNNNNGYAIQFGHVTEIDTRGNVASNIAVGNETWADGDILYVHPTVSGKLTNVEPKHSISTAIILDAASNGKIFVRPTSYGHLNDNHDVNVSGATNGQFLQYNSSTDYWVPSSSGNFTSLSVNGTGVISSSGGTTNYISKFTSSSTIGNSLIFDNGTNVGIGTVTPQSKVHITDTNDLNTTIEYTNNTAGFASGVRPLKLLLTGSNGVGVGAGVGIDFVTKSSSIEYTGARIISNRTDTSNNHALTFWAGGGTTSLSEYMRISSNGNVGIGISSPSHKLHVSGVIRSTSYITSDTEFRLNNLAFARVATMDGGGGFAGGYNVYLSGSMPKHNSVGALSSYYYSSDGTIRFYTNSSQSADTDASERLRITSAGNVGIRTTSPESSLTINTTIGSSSNINSTAGYAFGIHHSGMRITSPEDTSTNPNYPLINLLVSRPGGHQGGTASIDFDSRDRGNATNRGIMARILGGNAPNTAANTSGGGYLSLEVAPTGSTTPISRMVITRDGNVGIGTTSPQVLLHVNGQAYLQSLNLTNGTADRILATDTNKNVVGLNTSTYPTLTELSYVKDATSSIQAQLNTKAPLASPAFSGTPTAPTATSGTNTTQIATTAFVRTEISSLVDAAPGTLDTLNELAAALGDDPNFATTIASSIATKVTGTGTINYVPKFTAAQTLQNSLIFDNGTNVGVGLNSPDTKLHVEKSLAVLNPTNLVNHSAVGLSVTIPDVALDTGSGIAIAIGMNDRGRSYIGSIWDSSNKDQPDLAFYTTWGSNGVGERLRIKADGKVGIGTSTPSYALNVNPASNSNNGIQILNNSAGTSARSLLSLHNGSYGAEISLGGTSFTNDGFYRQNRLLISAPFITDYVTGQHYFHIGGGGTYQAVSGSTQVGVWDINALTLQNELRPTAGIAGGTLVGSSLTLKSTTNVGTTDHIKLVVGNNGATEAVRVINNGNVGIGTTTPTYKLQVNGSFAASTKSFRIDHPSKKDHSLEYGSLESPYHGVRLTGRGTVIKGVGTVSLPSYLKDLIHDDDTLNIQITNIKHGKTIYIDKIDLQNDRFIVKVDRAKSLGELQFCWTLTGVRKDVDHLVVEKEN